MMDNAGQGHRGTGYCFSATILSFLLEPQGNYLEGVDGDLHEVGRTGDTYLECGNCTFLFQIYTLCSLVMEGR